MSFPKKIVTSYSKSLFQNINNLPQSKQYKEFFDLSTLVLEEQKSFLPNVYICLPVTFPFIFADILLV